MANNIENIWYFEGNENRMFGQRREFRRSYGSLFKTGDDERDQPWNFDTGFWWGLSLKEVKNDERYHPAIRITFSSPTISELMKEIEQYVMDNEPKGGLHRENDGLSVNTWWFRPWWNHESKRFVERILHRAD